MELIWDPFSTYWVNYDLGLSTLPVSASSLVYNSSNFSSYRDAFPIPTAPPCQWNFSYSFRMGRLFLRNSLPVQSFISFSSATFSVKRTLRAAPAGWKCPPLTCTALAQCSGQVWNYALASKWHPTHCHKIISPTNRKRPLSVLAPGASYKNFTEIIHRYIVQTRHVLKITMGTRTTFISGGLGRRLP